MKRFLSILTLLFLVLFITGCEKKVLTIKTYTSLMEEMGFANEILDLTVFFDEPIDDDSQFNDSKNIDTTINSTKENSKIRCSLNIFDNEENAIKGTYLKSYGDNIPSMSEEKCSEKDNYAKCSRVLGSDYVVHVRVGKTFLNCSTITSERADLNKVINKLGY